MRTSSLQLFVLATGIVVVGCSGSSDASGPATGAGGTQTSTGGTTVQVGGAVSSGGKAAGGTTSVGVGGSIAPAGGSVATGGMTATGGAATGGKTASGGAGVGGVATGVGGAATGGKSSTGGTTASIGGTTASIGGTNGTGGAATGGKSSTGGTTATVGGTTGTGGAAAGGKSSTGGAAAGGTATGGKSSAGGTSATVGGTTGAGGASSSSGPDCSAVMPTGGTNVSISTSTNAWVSGKANGLSYGGWTNGSGGTITYFTNAHAFGAAWSSTGSNDFLAHLGLDFSPVKAYPYGTIVAQFVETKTASPTPSYSMIGMYGWMHNPCVEWYINEDSFGNLSQNGTAATIDGATYHLTTLTTTGTGGNACESGHTGSWVQMISTRASKRQCGTITLSDHFAAWKNQGWSLGSLASAYINVETGSGVGNIQFPVANVTVSP